MRSDEAKILGPTEHANPVYDRPADSWMCGRVGTAGACPNGPHRSGRCPLADACRPKRTWYGQRRRVVCALLGVATLVIGWSLLPSHSAKVMKPGELTSPHAQILSGKLTSARCAACHRSASLSPSKWFNSEIEGHRDVSQSDRCLECHHQTINRDVAKMAHNLPAETRKQILARISLASSRSPGRIKSSIWNNLAPPPAVDQNDVDCAACHREHRGATADMLAVSDAQCQTCHTQRFGDFATSHPAWGKWPYDRGGDIYFNHQTHMVKHFPTTMTDGVAARFDCHRCHERTENGEITRAVNYETGCQSCHDNSLRIESAKGIELFALPTLPSSVVRQTPWPAAAVGIPDGRVSAIAALLMRSDQANAEGLRRVGSSDLSRLNGNDPKIAMALQQTAAAHRKLLTDLALKGQPAIVERMSEQGISADTIDPIIHHLPVQLLIEAYQQWLVTPGGFQSSTTSPAVNLAIANSFVRQASEPPVVVRQTALNEEVHEVDRHNSETDDSLGDSFLLPLKTDEFKVFGPRLAQRPTRNTRPQPATPTRTQDPLAIDPLAIDPLAQDPLAQDPLAQDPLVGNSPPTDPLGSSPSYRSASPSLLRSPRRFDPATMMPSGGWYLDSTRLSISYRGNGHSDPVIRGTIELARRLSPSDPVRQQLLSTRSVIACLSCHQSATEMSGSWTSRALIGSKTEFTKFAHGPHLNVSQLSDCQHCHQVNRDGILPRKHPINLASFDTDKASEDETQGACEFKPLGKQACAACHNAKAAGESCVKCHRYHIHP